MLLLVYSIFMLFYGWITAIKYYQANKKGLLINEVSKEEQNKLFFIVLVVFLLLLLFIGIQSYDFFVSIFTSDIETLIDLPTYLEEYAIFANLGLSVLKVLWIPAKITKYILQVVFGTLSVFIFYSRYCLKKLKRLPNYLRRILYILCFADVVYVVIALF